MSFSTAVLVMVLILFIKTDQTLTANDGPICLICDDINNPLDCTKIATCGSTQKCSIEEYITTEGSVQHNLGCKEPNKCGISSIPPEYMTLCNECCDNDLCVVNLCGNRGFPTEFGPVCYHCEYPLDNPSHCDRVRVCESSEVCAVNMLPSGKYTVQCRDANMCQTILQNGVCAKCCSTELCNRDCSVYNITTVAVNASVATTSLTTITPMTSTSSCVDSPTCQTLLTMFKADGADICTEPSDRHYCNATCNLCSSTVSSRPHTPSAPIKTSTAETSSTVSSKPPTTFAPVKTSAAETPSTVSSKPLTTSAPVKTATAEASTTPSPTKSTSTAAPTTSTTTPTPTTASTTIRTTQTTVVDQCIFNPCVHGICSNHGNSYTCHCSSGYQGRDCDSVIDGCMSNPCVHGVCRNHVGGFTCSCSSGYEGQNCETSTQFDRCILNPCVYGTCSNHANGYTCACLSGYGGHDCDAMLTDYCLFNPCVHGTCSNNKSGYTCTCKPGVYGKNCDTFIDQCITNPCAHGTCQTESGGYICHCRAGYTGKNCDIAGDFS